MYLLSYVRLGVALGLVKDIPAETVNDLVLKTQSAHLQRLMGRELSTTVRGQERADLIRRRLGP